MANDADRESLRKEASADQYDDFYRTAASSAKPCNAYHRPYWDSHYYPLYRAAFNEVERWPRLSEHDPG